MASIAAIEADRGPDVEKYAVPLDAPRLYKWIVGSSDTADSVTVLSHMGGTAGRWKLQRVTDKGANLTDADVTITIAQGTWRTLPTILSANRVCTLGTTNAAAGDMIELTRLDAGAFTYAVVNGGVGAGTLVTLPISQRWWARFYFDGTNWLRRAESQLL